MEVRGAAKRSQAGQAKGFCRLGFRACLTTWKLFIATCTEMAILTDATRILVLILILAHADRQMERNTERERERGCMIHVPPSPLALPAPAHHSNSSIYTPRLKTPEYVPVARRYTRIPTAAAHVSVAKQAPESSPHRCTPTPTHTPLPLHLPLVAK